MGDFSTTSQLAVSCGKKGTPIVSRAISPGKTRKVFWHPDFLVLLFPIQRGDEAVDFRELFLEFAVMAAAIGFAVDLQALQE